MTNETLPTTETTASVTQEKKGPETLEAFQGRIKAMFEELAYVKMDDVSLGPWSMSKLKVLDKCPFQFYLKYILKLKIPSHLAEKDDPTSASVGSAAHRVLELALLGKTVEASFAATKLEFCPSQLTEEQWLEKVVPLEYNINAFNERIISFSNNNPIKRVLTELRMGVTKTWEPAGFFADDVWFRGVIDLIIMLVNGDIVIIDHKTGGGQGSIKPYMDQLNSYKVLFHHGVNPIVGAQSGIHYIAAGEVKMGPYAEKERIEGSLRRHLEWSVQAAIDKAIDLGFFKHVRGGYCKWCDYDKLGCKDGTLKPIELGTKKYFEIKQVSA
jgi:RecB family exonuclease